MEEVESIANFLRKIEEARSELTNLEDNTFIDNTVMAKVFFHLWAISIVWGKCS
jgi:hypothetical protein